jgi:hypothetical protein
MSNLGDYAGSVAKLTKEEKAGIEALGSFVGSLADLAGAAGLASLIIGIVTSLISSDNNALVPLVNEIDIIRTELERFIAQERVDALLTRVQGLDTFVAPTQTALQQLIAELPPNPPLTQAEVRTQIGNCLTVLNGLNTDDQWKADFLSQLYYDDDGAWAGQIRPPTTGGGGPNEQFFVFSTRYILVRFARSLGHFVAVGLTLDRRFRDNYLQEIQAYVTRLENAYTQVRAGITTLAAPTHGQLLEIKPDSDGNDAYVLLEGLRDGIWARGKNSPPESIGFNLIWFQMYGAFDLYGGYFAIGNYPGIPAPAAPPVNGQPPSDFFPKFDATHELRSIAARKIVYRELGLVAVRAILAKLKSIIGVGSLPDFDPESWWSLREIQGILAAVFDPSSRAPDPRKTIAWLNALSGASAETLRDALNALVLPIALTGAPTFPPQDGG